MQLATAYLFHARFLFTSMSRGGSGIWYVCAPFEEARTPDDLAIGEAAARCLRASKDGIADPDPLTVDDSFLAFAGANSWSALSRSAQCLEVLQDGSLLTISLLRDGHEDPALEVPNGDLAALGTAIRQQLETLRDCGR